MRSNMGGKARVLSQLMKTPGIKEELVKEIRRLASDGDDHADNETITANIVNQIRKSHMHIPVTNKMVRKLVDEVLSNEDTATDGTEVQPDPELDNADAEKEETSVKDRTNPFTH